MQLRYHLAADGTYQLITTSSRALEITRKLFALRLPNADLCDALFMMA